MEIKLEQPNIKSWAVEDRPREKMMRLGSRQLSNAELLAIILRSGSAKENAIQLSRRILSHYQNDIQRVSCLEVEELCMFNGVGPAKAVAIRSAFQLGKRAASHEGVKLDKIESASDIFTIMQPLIGELPHEEFWILLLNRSNRVIDKFQISSGGVSSTVVDAKLIFKKALNNLASSIIITHNHPSGNLRPSNPDISLTNKLVEGALLLDLKILDHIIITKSGYLSFVDEGLI